ncbi:hypothetical protein LCGC14_2958750 [marine sediment metagenome]|uniref:Uncharacterized protein n=1 Tax=marine sediment metagenome TaxID=412755 RepID=A0A0F8XCT6_9ZZZZ
MDAGKAKSVLLQGENLYRLFKDAREALDAANAVVAQVPVAEKRLVALRDEVASVEIKLREAKLVWDKKLPEYRKKETARDLSFASESRKLQTEVDVKRQASREKMRAMDEEVRKAEAERDAKLKSMRETIEDMNSKMIAAQISYKEARRAMGM